MITLNIFRTFQRSSRKTFPCILCDKCVCRLLCTSQPTQERFKLPPSCPETISHDCIGPPDADSNIRPTLFHIPKNETVTEKHFREKREDVQRWNHEFWAKHNRNFTEEKAVYITNYKGEKDRKPTSEELAEFYSKFLDKNRELHRNYNREWYKKNIGLLWPALKVSLQRLLNLK